MTIENRHAYLVSLLRTVPTTIAAAVSREPTAAALKSSFAFSTLLHLDLAGFTAWCDSTISEEGDGLGALSVRLSDFFTRLLEDAFFPYGGLVVQFGGDSLSVVFRDDDHALRALTAAVLARSITDEFPQGDNPMRVRIGLSSGMLGLVTIGDEAQKIQVVAGEKARVAVSLQSKGEPGQIIMDATTYDEVASSVTATPLDDDDEGFRLDDLVAFPLQSEIVAPLENTQDVEAKISLLEPFVAPSLRARLRTVPSGWRIEGELRETVVMFIDIIGLVDFRDKGSANAASILARSLRRYGGVVTKVDLAQKGHRVMANFGLTRPSDVDAERAILAALEVVSSLKHYSATHDNDCSVRIGIHHGLVYFGAIGSDRRYDVTCIGDTVNTAARIMGGAQKNEVAVSTEVLDRTTALFDVSAPMSLDAKGKSEPVEIRIVHSPRHERSHYVQKRHDARTLYGRDRVLRKLQERTRAALKSEGGVIGIEGDNGSGKSALLSKTINAWLDGGGIGMICRCQLAWRNQPLAPLRSMFRSFLGSSDDESSEVLHQRAEKALASFDLAPRFRRALLTLIVGDVEDSSLNVFSTNTETWNDALEGVLEFVKQRAQQEPVLYIVEDLHNADALTVELCRRAALDSFSVLPAMLIYTHQDDKRLDLLNASVKTRVILEALDLRSMKKMLAFELRAQRVDEKVAAFVWKRSLGMPGAALEIVDFLRKRSLLRVVGGEVQAPAFGLETVQELVPETLAHITLARLDDMSSVERRVLRCASAIGLVFTKDLLLHAASDRLDEERLELSLERMMNDGLVTAEGGERDRYRFRDNAVRAIAYKTIPEGEREAVHKRIAEGLLRSGERVNAVTLASHRERGGQHALALDAYENAIRTTARSGLDEETIALIDKWRELGARSKVGQNASVLNPKTNARMSVKKLIAIARCGAPRKVIEEARQIQSQHWEHLDKDARRVTDLWVGAAYLSMGREARAESRLSRVYEHARVQNARAEAARLLSKRARIYRAQEIARQWIGRALELSESSDRRTMRAQIEEALISFNDGSIDEARVMLVAVKERARRKNLLRLAAHAGALLGACEIATRDFEHADEELVEARGVARAVGSKVLLASIEQRRGQIALYEKRYQVAFERLSSSYALAKELGEFFIQCEAAAHLGLAKSLMGDVEGGEKILNDVSHKAQNTSLFFLDLVCSLHKARIFIEKGEKKNALAMLAEAAGHKHAHVPLFDAKLTSLTKRADKLR